MNSYRSQCCDCGHICCMYMSDIKCLRDIKSDKYNKGVDGCKKCEYWIRKIRHVCNDANDRVIETTNSFCELTGTSSNDNSHDSRTFVCESPPHQRRGRNMDLSRSSSSKSKSSRSSKSSSPNKRSIHIPRFGSSRGVRGVQSVDGNKEGGKNERDDGTKEDGNREGKVVGNREVSADNDININTTVNFHKNEVIFASNSLAKNSSTIPCDSISDQYGRKIWSWSLLPPPSNGIMTNYDGINANAGIDIEGKYAWSVNFYTLSPKSNPSDNPSDDSSNNPSANSTENPDHPQGGWSGNSNESSENPASSRNWSGTIRLNLSLTIHKGQSVSDVELIKEYEIIHKGDEPNYHYVELGDLDIKSGIALILLRRVADDDIDEVYPNNIYIIGLTGTEK